MKTWKKISALLLSFGMLLSLLAAAPVSAADEPETGSITIHKLEVSSKDELETLKNAAEGRSGGLELNLEEYDDLKDLPPMKDIEFTLEKIIEKDGQEVTAQNAQIDSSFKAVIKSTNAAGIVIFDNLEEGTYKLTESPDSRVPNVIDPFLVSVPTYNETYKTSSPSGEEFLYNIHVYPKNLIHTEGPDIEKDVVKPGNNDATVNMQEEFKWIITTDIPNDITADKLPQEYKIFDVLDSRLNFGKNVSVILKAASGNGKEDKTLTEGSENEYEFIRKDVSDQDKESGRDLTWNLTQKGFQALADYAGGKVEVRFTTTINETAQLGTAIENQAHLDYTNNDGNRYTPRSDKPEVHTGGVGIKKVDKAEPTKTLSGAEFKIYKTLAEAKEGKNAIQRNGGDYTVTSNDDGIAFFEGLAYGDSDKNNIGQGPTEGETTYWVVETKAPVDPKDNKTYNRLKDPFEVTVTHNSHNAEPNTYKTVYNAKDNYELPFTGGTGLLVFLGGGAALLAAAYLISKSGKNKTAK